MSALFRTAPRINSETSGAARSARCTIVNGCPPPFNNKHICVDKFSCRANVNDGRKGRKIHNNKLILLPQFVEDPTQFGAGENEKVDQEAPRRESPGGTPFGSTDPSKQRAQAMPSQKRVRQFH